ncbi:hypothetical protein N510_002636 [Firmicutes bacterium ASF500]|nr:hypothetical protein N510_002636 [Firmicutes bacterium ASF500]
MHSYRLKIHPRVSGQLEKHAEFIARVSRPAAVRFRTEFKKTLIRLVENPYLFPLLESDYQSEDFYRKALFGKWYKVIFYVEADVIYLDAVIDGRREISADEIE